MFLSVLFSLLSYIKLNGNHSPQLWIPFGLPCLLPQNPTLNSQAERVKGVFEVKTKVMAQEL